MTEHSKRPDTIEHLYHLGNIWRLKGNIANAELNYQQILAQDPTFVKAYERLGLLMLVSGQVKKLGNIMPEPWSWTLRILS